MYAGILKTKLKGLIFKYFELIENSTKKPPSLKAITAKVIQLLGSSAILVASLLLYTLFHIVLLQIEFKDTLRNALDLGMFPTTLQIKLKVVDVSLS